MKHWADPFLTVACVWGLLLLKSTGLQGADSQAVIQVVRDVVELRTAVAAGGDIHLRAGDYVLTETLLIDRPVRLDMAPEARLLAGWGAGAGDAMVRLESGADRSELRNLTLDGRGHRLQGLRLQGVADIRVSGIEVTDVGEQGIYVHQCERVLVQDARLKRTQTHEETSMMGAVRVQSSMDVLIERVHVHESGGKGIAFGNSRRCGVRDSIVHDTLRDAGDGIYFNNSHDSSVIRCHVIDPQGNALKISRRSSGILVRDCWLSKKRGVGRTLFIQGGVDCQVSGSYLSSEMDGPAVQVSRHPLENVGGPALRNLITGNRIASAHGRFFRQGQTGVDGTVYEGNLEVRTVHNDD